MAYKLAVIEIFLY